MIISLFLVDKIEGGDSEACWRTGVKGYRFKIEG